MKNIILTSSLITLAFLLQTSFLNGILPYEATPDIALIILVYFSFSKGAWVGQFSGFTGGLVQDFLTSSPIGFNAFIKTFIGYITGRFKGAIQIDKFLMPVILTTASTLGKGVLSLILAKLLSLGLTGSLVFDKGFWIQLVANIVLAPIVFLLLSFIDKIVNPGRDNF